LGIGEENSGKLVTVVRHHAKLIAEERGLEWSIVDGPPGIGCPVISSLTGAGGVLIVTEPTISGIHDMKRVADLAAYFRIPRGVCINKWDLNPEVCEEITAYCNQEGIQLMGRIPYDRVVSQALIQRKILVEYDAAGTVSQEIRAVWERVQALVSEPMEERAEARS
jgi:MinD superfamily P-loop ATPase